MNKTNKKVITDRKVVILNHLLDMIYMLEIMLDLEPISDECQELIQQVKAEVNLL